ncbi:MAG: hypothetical protein IT521_09190 [Burkholderiales bacterium]|nr:hypothetical protein [Burkholderiales bacterium]
MIPNSFVAAAFLVCIALTAQAQSGSHLADPAASAPSRWQVERDQLDSALRARALVATDARSLWVAGQLDAGDPVARADAFAQARIMAPEEKLFLASLAMACLAPVRPLPAPCDATDRLADWALRDADNGVPLLLLADRARARNNVASMGAFLEQAAKSSRFDDYRNQAALLIWDAVRALPGSAEPAAKVELAASYGVLHEPYAVGQMRSLCRDAPGLPENVRAACHAAGIAVAQRAANWSLRSAGARLAQRSAAAGAEQEAARLRLSEVQRRAYECAEMGNVIASALQSPVASVRADAVAQWEARLRQEAQFGEVAACALPVKG